MAKESEKGEGGGVPSHIMHENTKKTRARLMYQIHQPPYIYLQANVTSHKIEKSLC